MRPQESRRAHRPGMHHVLPHHRHLLARLQQEWDRLASSPAAIAAATDWPLGPVRVESLDDVLRSAGYGGGGNAVDDGDRVLHCLVQIARDDALAARVVLQRLLPGISTMARRNAGAGCDAADTLDDALSTAWTVIRLYPIDQRPRFLAANMLREIEYRAFRKERRRKAEHVPTLSTVLDTFPAPDASVCSAAELRELLDEARAAGFATEDVELAERLAAGTRAEELALEKQVTSRTVRNHRALVVHRLRRLALARCA